MEIIIKVKRVCVVRKATVMASLALRHANPDGLFFFFFLLLLFWLLPKTGPVSLLSKK